MRRKIVLLLVGTVAAAFLLAWLMLTVLFPHRSDGPWPPFGGEGPERLWHAPPPVVVVVGDGVVWFSGRESGTRVYDMATGEERPPADGSGRAPGFAEVDGIVYRRAKRSGLYGLDAKRRRRVWSFDTDGFRASRPTAAEGVLYFTTLDGTLHAVDIATRKRTWRFPLDGTTLSRPAVAGGTVFVGSGSADSRMVYDDEPRGSRVMPPVRPHGFFYAVNASTGKLKWRRWTETAPHCSPAAASGVVYFATEDDSLYAVDAATGALKWRARPRDSIFTSPTVSAGVAYVGSDRGYLFALDAGTGKETWRFKTGDFIEAPPVIAGTLACFGSGDGHLHAVDIRTGQLVWQLAAGGPVVSSPALGGGLVCVGSLGEGADPPCLLAVDAATGDQRWTFRPGGPVYCSPAIADGTVYFGSDDRQLYALDLATGRERWHREIGEGPAAAPLVVGGVLYTVTGWGDVLAIDRATGERIWEQRIYGSWSMDCVATPLTVVGDELCFGTSAAYLHGFDLKTGAGKRRLNEGRWSVGPSAVDNRAVYYGSWGSSYSPGTFHAVNLRTEQDIWHAQADRSWTTPFAPPTVTEGTVYFGCTDGTLYALDAKTGKIRWRFRTSEPPGEPNWRAPHHFMSWYRRPADVLTH